MVVKRMGRINVVISDELERAMRKIALTKFGGKKGSLKEAVEEALKEYIERHRDLLG